MIPAVGSALVPVAHAGHWLVSVLYARPVLIVIGSLVVTAVRSRRREAKEHEDAEEPDDQPFVS